MAWIEIEDPNDGKTDFITTVAGLQVGEQYSARAWIELADGNKIYAKTNNVVTEITTVVPPSADSITTKDPLWTSYDRAYLGYHHTINYGTIDSIGLYYSTTSVPVLPNDPVDTIKLPTNNSWAEGLTSNTQYFVQAIMILTDSTILLGGTKTFTTGELLPIVSTESVTDIDLTSAVGHGDITANGASPLTSVGIAYAQSSSPTIANNIVESAAVLGQFSVDLVGLTMDSLYYTRAFASTSGGTAYGPETVYFYTDRVKLRGYLYNWFAVNSHESDLVTGLHVPSTTEIQQLTTYLVNDGHLLADVGDTLKSTTLWDSSGAGTDDYNFNGLPCGFREDEYGSYYEHTSNLLLWTSSIVGADEASTAELRLTYSDLYIGQESQIYGGSIRCVRDLTQAEKDAKVDGEIVAIHHDFDGAAYNIVRIGDQGWMTSNLHTETFLTGTAIPKQINDAQWKVLDTAAYCIYANTDDNAY